MAEAEHSDGETAADESNESGESVTLTLDGTEVSLTVPTGADSAEAAAIASAVGAHLHDRRMAVAAAAAEGGEHDRVDAWTLAGRMKSLGRSRWPKDVRRGEEWKASARAHY